MSDLILIADDDGDIRDLLRILLEKDGYRVLEAENGLRAVAAVRDHRDISLVILDIMMPELDGFAAARGIRALSDVPILFLTARSSDADRMSAYADGGDDYIVKPFHAMDLRLKIGAMLSRYRLYREKNDATRENKASAEDGTASGVIQLPGEILWNPEERAVLKNGNRVVLTDREYELFARLARERGECLSPAVLYEDVWGETYLASSSNTVIVHIANLRRKLESDPSSPVVIRTVWGKGYRIE